MTILSYIVSISLVIISVAKTTEIFIKSDQALNSIQNEFKQITRQKLKSFRHEKQKGSISFSAAFLTVILSALLLFYVTKMTVEFKEAIYRKNSYLCMGYLNSETLKYIREMAFFNWSIRAAYAAKHSGAVSAQSQAIFQGLVLSRDLRHMNYLRKLIKNKYCGLPETINYLSHTPFKIKASKELETNIDKTSIVREKKWNTTLSLIPKGIRLKKSFCLKSQFSIKNAFTPSPQIETEEVSLADLLNSKCYFGSSS